MAEQQPKKKDAFDTPFFNKQDGGFFNSLNQSKVPHLILAAETDDFTDEVTQQWRDEGFDTVYVPLGEENVGNEFVKRVHAIGDKFGVGEYYGIVGKC